MWRFCILHIADVTFLMVPDCMFPRYERLNFATLMKIKYLIVKSWSCTFGMINQFYIKRNEIPQHFLIFCYLFWMASRRFVIMKWYHYVNSFCEILTTVSTTLLCDNLPEIRDGVSAGKRFPHNWPLKRESSDDRLVPLQRLKMQRLNVYLWLCWVTYWTNS